VAAVAGVEVQALAKSIHLLANVAITQSAKNIYITGKQEVLLQGAGSWRKYSASGIEQGGSHYTVHGGYATPKGKSRAVHAPTTTKGERKQNFVAHYHDENAVQGAAFEMTFDDGTTFAGKLETGGKSDTSHLSSNAGILKLGEDTRLLQSKGEKEVKTYRPT